MLSGDGTADVPDAKRAEDVPDVEIADIEDAFRVPANQVLGTERQLNDSLVLPVLLYQALDMVPELSHHLVTRVGAVLLHQRCQAAQPLYDEGRLFLCFRVVVVVDDIERF